MKTVILLKGSSAIIKMVGSADIEKIKAEYPGWEVSVLTPAIGEIKLEAQAHGYDYAYSTISIVE